MIGFNNHQVVIALKGTVKIILRTRDISIDTVLPTSLFDPPIVVLVRQEEQLTPPFCHHRKIVLFRKRTNFLSGLVARAIGSNNFNESHFELCVPGRSSCLCGKRRMTNEKGRSTSDGGGRLQIILNKNSSRGWWMVGVSPTHALFCFCPATDPWANSKPPTHSQNSSLMRIVFREFLYSV